MEKRNESIEKCAKAAFNTKIHEGRNEEAEKSRNCALKNRQRKLIMNLTTLKSCIINYLFVDFLEHDPCCCLISDIEISLKQNPEKVRPFFVFPLFRGRLFSPFDSIYQVGWRPKDSLSNQGAPKRRSSAHLPLAPSKNDRAVRSHFGSEG